MWRTLVLAIVLALAASGPARAAPLIGGWESCAQGDDGRVADCAPLIGVKDPQDRELWLRARVRTRTAEEPGALAFYISGTAASQVWFNGVPVGQNGQPGATAAAERPGRYDVSFPLADNLWRAGDNELVVRLSSFHAGMRLAHPIGGAWIGPYPSTPRLVLLAVTFAAAGALFAAAFGFGAVYAMRRTPSSLNLAALAATAGLQAVVENLRGLVHYLYPVHLWRVAAIWALAAMFAWLLAAYAATRFAPRRRPLLLGAATALIAASFLFGGFDVKTAAALLVGAGLAGAAAVIGVIQGRAQAWPTLAFLIVFSLVAMAAPEWFLDVSFFVMAAGLTLPLLILEVVRLGRDDRDREAALTRAASRPDRLAVATGKGVVLTPLAGIVVILGADDYADLRLLGGASLLHAARLDRLEAQLPGFFLRVHRSAIVNLNHVERLERDAGRWRLILAEGLSAPVSRSRVAAVRAALDSPAPVTGGLRTPAVAAWPGAKAR